MHVVNSVEHHIPHTLMIVFMLSLPKRFDTLHIISRAAVPSSNSKLSCDADMDIVLVSEYSVGILIPSSLKFNLDMAILKFGGGTGVFSRVQFIVAPCGGRVSFSSKQKFLPMV